MTIVLRVPKRQLRVVVVGLAVVAFGAGVAAQTPPPSRPAPAGQPVAVAESPVATVAPAPAEPQQEPGTAPPQQEPQTPPASPPQQDPQTPPASPPQEQQPPPVQQPTATGGVPDLLTPEEREALALVERLIQDQEGVLMGTGFDYQSGGRRDPFRSLLAEISAVSVPGVRPFGLPGFLISEIELKAIAAVQGRWHAMVIGPNQRAYFLEVGTELFDGHVVQIGPGEVVFEQVVPDLTGARRTRQVIKRLRTTDGGGETP